MYIVRAGQVAWSYNIDRKGEISDAVCSRMATSCSPTIWRDADRADKKVLWNYDAPTNCEIHTAQPIGTNHVIFIQNGPEPRLFVANLAPGRWSGNFPCRRAIPKARMDNSATPGSRMRALIWWPTWTKARLPNTTRRANRFGRRCAGRVVGSAFETATRWSVEKGCAR